MAMLPIGHFSFFHSKQEKQSNEIHFDPADLLVDSAMTVCKVLLMYRPFGPIRLLLLNKVELLSMLALKNGRPNALRMLCDWTTAWY